MKADSVKRNLIIAIAMLILTTATCISVAFAYFTSSDDSGNNSITTGVFAIGRTDEVLDGAVSAAAAENYIIKDPTVINVDKIDANHEKYKTDGDDEYFDDYVVPLLFKIENQSLTDINVTVEPTVTATRGGATVADYSKALRFFYFDKEVSANLLDNTHADYGKYADVLRRECAAASTSLDVSAATTIEGVTNLKLAAGQAAIAEGLKSAEQTLKAATAENKASDEHKATIVALLWLDWRAYNRVATASSDPLTVSINVTITGTNEFTGSAV